MTNRNGNINPIPSVVGDLRQFDDKNCYELRLSNGNLIFFSYATPVAAKIGDSYLRTTEHYSNTTSRHINYWLGRIQKAVASTPVTPKQLRALY